FCDHTEETRSGNTTTHANDSLLEYDSFCFEIEPDHERLINTELLIDDSIPFPNNESSESDFENPSVPLPPPKPPDTKFDFEPDSEEEISVVRNAIRHEFDVSFMFVIRIFMPYLICSKVFSFLLSAEIEDTIFDLGFTPHRLKFLVFGYLSCLGHFVEIPSGEIKAHNRCYSLLKGQGSPGQNKTPGPWSAWSARALMW
nr:hypothetical protein [Tanacetum cinerariifolium]